MIYASIRTFVKSVRRRSRRRGAEIVVDVCKENKYALLALLGSHLASIRK